MKNYCLIILLSATALSPAYAEQSYEQALQEGCNKVKQYARLGKKYYDQKQYQHALTEFKNQASWSSFCLLNQDETGLHLTEYDVEVANNNVGLSYAKLGQPQWARALFSLNENSKLSKFNLSQLPPPAATNNVSGRYVTPSGFGQWSSITVKKDKKKYTIHFEGYYFGLRGLIYGPNMGEFSTTMPLNASSTTFKQDQCQLQLKFQQNHLIVTQQGEDFACGFGHNVSASGTYLKVEN